MFWDPLFEHVSAVAGAPVEQIKMITCFLLSYPLGSLFVRIPPTRPNLAHCFSLVVSFFFFVPLLGLGTGLLQLLVSCAGTYLIVAFSRSPQMPWMVFLLVFCVRQAGPCGELMDSFTMGHLTLSHLRETVFRVHTDRLDITFAQMVLVMKLTMFAWNVHDGRRTAEELDASQEATKLQHVPSPLAFLGYWSVTLLKQASRLIGSFFFPSVMAGPSMDYATYDALVKHTIYSTPPPGMEDRQGKLKRRIPYGRKRVAYLHLAMGLAFLAVYAVYQNRGSYARILSPAWDSWGWLTRFGFIQFAGIIARTKYYAAWSLTEGACILTGIGFNGYDPKTGRTLWNRLRNIDILSIETAESFKVLFDSWNCRTNVWLRDCVYKRLVKKGQKPGSLQSMATFLTSAFWHGVAPGYYFAFLLAGVLTSLGRQLRHFVRPYFLPSSSTPTSPPNALPQYPFPHLPKRAYDFIGWILVQTNLNFTASAFLLLNLRDVIAAWRRMYFYSPVLAICTMIFFHLGGRRSLRRGLEVRGKLPKKDKPPSIKVPKASEPEDASAESKYAPHDETDPKDLRWVKHALDNPGYQDSGRGMGPDGGLFDEFVKGQETPRREGSAPPFSS